jgi:Cu/Ag efflux pump CusA
MRPSLSSFSFGSLSFLAPMIGLLSAPGTLHASPPDAEIRVLVPAFGLTSLEVERVLAAPVEYAAQGIRGVQHVSSRSSASGAVVRFTAVPAAALWERRAAISTRLQDVNLPPGSMASLDAPRSQVGYRYTVEAPNLSLSELRSLQKWVIVRALRQVPGVAEVSTCGGGQSRFEVLLDLPRLTAAGLAVNDAADALHEAIPNRFGSPVRLGLVRAQQVQCSPTELGEIPLATRAGVPVRVRDVASTLLGASPPTCLAGRDGRSDLLTAQVWLRSEEDAQAVQAAIHARVMQLNNELPKGVRLQPFGFRPRGASSRVGDFVQRLTQRVFPSAVPSALRLRLLLPLDTQPQVVQSLSAALREMAGRLPFVESVWTQAGLAGSQLDEPAAGELELLVALRADSDPSMSKKTAASLLDELLSGMAKLQGVPPGLAVDLEDSLGGWPAGASRPVGLRLGGPDLAELTQLAERLRALLAAAPPICALRVEGVELRPQINVEPDRKLLAAQGLSSSALSAALRIAIPGQTVEDVFQGERRLPVVLRLAGVADLPTALQRVLLKSSSGALIPLRSLVTVTTEQQPAVILRQDGRRNVLVRVMAPTLDEKQLLKLTHERAAALKLPVGTSLTWDTELAPGE